MPSWFLLLGDKPREDASSMVQTAFIANCGHYRHYNGLSI